MTVRFQRLLYILFSLILLSTSILLISALIFIKNKLAYLMHYKSRVDNSYKNNIPNFLPLSPSPFLPGGFGSNHDLQNQLN